MSNLGEQAAGDATNQQLATTGQQIQMQQAQQNQAAQAEQAQTDIASAQIDQARKFQTVQNKLRTNQLLNDLSRDRGSLDLEKDKARLEQTAFLLSMQDKKYTDQLQDIGRKRRLDNEANFTQEMEQMALGAQYDLLKQKLGGKDILAASDREYKQALANMTIADAQKAADLEMAANEKIGASDMEIAKYVASQKARQTAYEQQAKGISTILSGALKTGSKIADKKSTDEEDEDEGDSE
jgi:hypothetical protein